MKKLNFHQIMADKMESALSSVEEGVGRFVYTGDGMNLNLTPLVAAIIAGILLLIPIIINLASLISIPTFSSGGSGEKQTSLSPMRRCVKVLIPLLAL